MEKDKSQLYFFLPREQKRTLYREQTIIASCKPALTADKMMQRMMSVMEKTEKGFRLFQVVDKNQPVQIKDSVLCGINLRNFIPKSVIFQSTLHIQFVEHVSNIFIHLLITYHY